MSWRIRGGPFWLVSLEGTFAYTWLGHVACDLRLFLTHQQCRCTSISVHLFSLGSPVSQVIHQLLGSLQVNADFLFLPPPFFFFNRFYTTSCVKSYECMSAIKMAFSQFEHVFGNICLGVGMVKYLGCPVSSLAPPSFETNFFLLGWILQSVF